MIFPITTQMRIITSECAEIRNYDNLNVAQESVIHPREIRVCLFIRIINNYEIHHLTE